MKAGAAARLFYCPRDPAPSAPEDVPGELADEVADGAGDEGHAEAAEGGVGADAVVAGCAALPDVGQRARGHRAREARVVRLQVPVVVARHEEAADGVTQTAAELLTLRALVARVLAEERRVEAVAEEPVRGAGGEDARAGRAPVGHLVAPVLVRESVFAYLPDAAVEGGDG